MNHQDWITAIATAIAAAVGGLAGGVLALAAAASTNKQAQALARQDREAQAELATAQRQAALEAAADERELNRREQRDAIARNAAVRLLGRIGELDRVLPMINRYRPGTPSAVAASPTDEQRLRTLDGVDAFRGGLRTDLLLINDADVVERYRELARLVHELQSDLAAQGLLNRAVADVSNYVKYVLITLQRFIGGQSLPIAAEPPILRRNTADGSTWTPQEIPEDWDRV